jgi:hypothetical protein
VSPSKPCGSRFGTDAAATRVSRRDNHSVLRLTKPDERLVRVQAFFGGRE